MVRSAAERAYLPTRNLLEEIGDMMILTGRTIVSALRPPYPYGGEFVSQFLFALRLCWFPLLISTVCINYAAPGLQAANFLTIFGSLDRLGGFFVLAAIREIGPNVTAIVLAGVAGTAITADLGARKIREELDALQVLGVDPIKNLVVPRFLALMIATGLFDIYALLFGLFGDPGGARQRPAFGAVLGDVLRQRHHHRPVGLGAEDDDLRRDHRDRVLLQGHDRFGRGRGCRARGQPGRGGDVPVDLRVRLRLHPDAARHPSGHPGDQVSEPLAVPREWISATGEIAGFTGNIVRDVWGLRVFRFFGEALRQSGILIISSTLIIWALMFILGLECGIEGLLHRGPGAPAYSGVFSAWCDLREIIPYAFGYMMAAKVGTGIVAELGAMRISEEIDALEVMGIDSMTFLCATRLLAAWMRAAVRVPRGSAEPSWRPTSRSSSRVGYVSSGGYLLIFWQFQNPADFLYSLIKAMVMATAIVLVGCYYGYNASGGPVGVGTATAKSMVFESGARALDRDARHPGLLGRQPAVPIGG